MFIDDTLFAEKEKPMEEDDAWECTPTPVAQHLSVDSVPPLLSTVLAGTNTFQGDVDKSFTRLIAVSNF